MKKIILLIILFIIIAIILTGCSLPEENNIEENNIENHTKVLLQPMWFPSANGRMQMILIPKII